MAGHGKFTGKASCAVVGIYCGGEDVQFAVATGGHIINNSVFRSHIDTCLQYLCETAACSTVGNNISIGGVVIVSLRHDGLGSKPMVKQIVNEILFKVLETVTSHIKEVVEVAVFLE